jgi:hypothetical protein
MTPDYIKKANKNLYEKKKEQGLKKLSENYRRKNKKQQ